MSGELKLFFPSTHNISSVCSRCPRSSIWDPYLAKNVSPTWLAVADSSDVLLLSIQIVLSWAQDLYPVLPKDSLIWMFLLTKKKCNIWVQQLQNSWLSFWIYLEHMEPYSRKYLCHMKTEKMFKKYLNLSGYTLAFLSFSISSVTNQ